MNYVIPLFAWRNLPIPKRRLISAGTILRSSVLFLLLSSTVPVWADITRPYLEPGINPYREQASEEGTESIDPYTGMLKVRHLDVFVPGNGGLDIKVWRSYDTAKVSTLLGTLGLGWTFHFGLLNGDFSEIGTATCNPGLFTSSPLRPVFELPDGTVTQFYRAPAGSVFPYISKNRWTAACAGSASGGLVIRAPDGTRFDVTQLENISGLRRWHVKRITDKHGNWLNFDYEMPTGGLGYLHLQKITSSDGRLVTFAYMTGVAGSVRKLVSVTANGATWQYGYVNFDAYTTLAASQSYSLAKVTRPDGRTWQYAYQPLPISASSFLNGYLSEISAPHGGVKRYTTGIQPNGLVGSGNIRITKKAVLDGVNPIEHTWTYIYRPNISGVDITDVVHPAGVTSYKHVSAYYLPYGSAWRAGLLLEKADCPPAAGTTCDPDGFFRGSAYVERLDWGGQIISPDQYLVNGVGTASMDLDGVRAPILTRKTIYPLGVLGTAHVTEYQQHDSYGNPARIVESGNAANRTTNLTYYNNPGAWIIGIRARETVDATWVTDRSFDSKGNVLVLTRHGVATNYTYYSTGDVASVTDAKGGRTDFADYYRGAARREDQPGGVTIYRTVNPTGTVASETNGEGHLISYEYDGLNRLTKVVPPAGNQTSIGWFAQGTGLAKRVTRGSFEETTRFDGLGRPIEITKVDTVSQSRVRRAYRYDGLGRKTVEIYPTDSLNTNIAVLPKVEYAYDHRDRLIQIKHADAKTRQLQYLTGNQIRITNENGAAYVYTYRSLGDPEQRELMGVSAPVPAANVTYARNALGQITAATQAGVTRTLQYDSRAYLSKVLHPEIGWVTYTRDALGNPLSKSVGVSPNARTISYTYDARNRLTNVVYPDATTPAVSLDYNRVDDVVSASRGVVTRTYAYDANRNLTDEALHVDGRVFGLRYDYDGNDAVSHVTYPDGQVVSLRPDALGRPTEVSPYVSSIGYHPSGQVSSMAYANGVSTTQAFNTRLWPQQMSVIAPSGALLNTAYGYDGLGNVTSMVDSIDSSYNRTLGYDLIDRLVSASGQWGAGSITYDGRGNILEQRYGTNYVTTYAYDASNRLASYNGGSPFVYDAWGNATRSGNAVSHHLFDDASNLYCASCDSASPSWFEYDANNYRVKKTRNGVVTYSLYAKDGNLMMEYSPTSGDLKQFAYHNKKQVAMRHVVDPTLNLGQWGALTKVRFAVSIPRHASAVEPGWLPDWLRSDLLLSDLRLANAN